MRGNLSISISLDGDKSRRFSRLSSRWDNDTIHKTRGTHQQQIAPEKFSVIVIAMEKASTGESESAEMIVLFIFLTQAPLARHSNSLAHYYLNSLDSKILIHCLLDGWTWTDDRPAAPSTEAGNFALSRSRWRCWSTLHQSTRDESRKSESIKWNVEMMSWMKAKAGEKKVNEEREHLNKHTKLKLNHHRRREFFIAF